jgi:two-component system KDP operon response regulator KdpE
MNAAPIKVLVIDDEPPIRKLLRMGLSTQGYEILEASNGKIALELLTQEPALIILDLGLPDIQGTELLRMIRGRNESVPDRSACRAAATRRGKSAGARSRRRRLSDKAVREAELLAWMRAALRHQLQVQGERLRFDQRSLGRSGAPHAVKVGEREVKLSPKEYESARAGAARRQGADPPFR